MSDIRNPKLLYLKGGLFLVLGLMAAGILLAEHWDLRFAALLAVAIWAFARAYYFVFYVIEHYVDPGYKFAGLWSFAQYVLRRNSAAHRNDSSQRSPHDQIERKITYENLK
ncbi:MAG TPA: hypothetical protein VGM05_02000 [Planctomycetaceae bacterium]|jgi:hypothetical protein